MKEVLLIHEGASNGLSYLLAVCYPAHFHTYFTRHRILSVHYYGGLDFCCSLGTAGCPPKLLKAVVSHVEMVSYIDCSVKGRIHPKTARMACCCYSESNSSILTISLVLQELGSGKEMCRYSIRF